MDKIARIRQEIERRKSSNEDSLELERANEDAIILGILDILEQQEPDVDLENEIATWIPTHIEGGGNIREGIIEWAGIVARHFYELGKNAK